MATAIVEDGIEKIGNGKWRVNVDRGWDADYDSHPRHRLVDQPRFLEGNQLTRDKTETDSQRQKLYDAQRYVTDGQLYDSMEEVAREVYDIISKAWWQRRYGTGRIKLRPGNGARRANARGSSVSGNLNFPRFSRHQRTIIHELIHLTVPVPHAWHGRLYASRYLEAIYWRLGEDAGDSLKEGFREENVKWHPRRKCHADHLSQGALRKIIDEEPDWADMEEIKSKKAVKPPLTL